MPRFAANLSFLFNDMPFLHRFAAAKQAGFKAVEFLFPYEFSAQLIAEKLQQHELQNVLFNLPPGDWAAGERGIAILPGREKEFADGVAKAIEYAKAFSCPRVHALAGILPAGSDKPALQKIYLSNLKYAAAEMAKHDLTLLIEPINTHDMPGYFSQYTGRSVRYLPASRSAEYQNADGHLPHANDGRKYRSEHSQIFTQGWSHPNRQYAGTTRA
jgi:2-dehydrotetronate isomerase